MSRGDQNRLGLMLTLILALSLLALAIYLGYLAYELSSVWRAVGAVVLAVPALVLMTIAGALL